MMRAGSLHSTLLTVVPLQFGSMTPTKVSKLAAFTSEQRPSTDHQGLLARAAAKFAHVLRERNGYDLERLSHCRVDMDHIDEVISSSPKA
jgi:hypothetical protein